MQSAIVLEASAVASEDFEANFFNYIPTDARYLMTVFQANFVSNSLGANAESVQFVLPQLQSNNVYALHNAMLFVKAKIVDDNGAKPPNGAKVAPINNTVIIFPSCTSDTALRNAGPPNAGRPNAGRANAGPPNSTTFLIIVFLSVVFNVEQRDGKTKWNCNF